MTILEAFALLDSLDGGGLVITDYDLLGETVKEKWAHLLDEEDER